MTTGRHSRGSSSGRVSSISWPGVFDLYLAKRALLRPYAALMKRLVPVEDPFIARMLEIHRYTPPLLLLGLRMRKEPDLLVTANQVRVALDVGAYDGHWAREIHERHGATVYSFEPLPSAYEQTRAYVAGCERIHLMPYGLSDADGSVEFVQAGPGSTALVDSIGRLEPTSGAPEIMNVQMRDVKAVFDDLGLTLVDFVNINIEGGEFDLLDRLIETGYVRRCRTLQIQFHEWIPGAYGRRRNIHRRLRRTHRLEWNYSFVWERWVTQHDSKTR